MLIDWLCRCREEHGSESGFTLMELLIITSIIGILALLALTSFRVYKDNAEYAKATSDFNAFRTAFEVGDQDALPGDAMALTYTGTGGGAVGAGMEPFLPHAQTSRGVEIGASYTYCDSNDPPMNVKQYMTIEPCNHSSDHKLEWFRFCGGTEVLLEHVAGGHC